jgi:hypothetical protein
VIGGWQAFLSGVLGHGGLNGISGLIGVPGRSVGWNFGTGQDAATLLPEKSFTT